MHSLYFTSLTRVQHEKKASFFLFVNRAKEADQLKDELTQARMSEKLAKERLLEVARVSPTYPVCIDTPYFMVIYIKSLRFYFKKIPTSICIQ